VRLNSGSDTARLAALAGLLASAMFVSCLADVENGVRQTSCS